MSVSEHDPAEVSWTAGTLLRKGVHSSTTTFPFFHLPLLKLKRDTFTYVLYYRIYNSSPPAALFSSVSYSRATFSIPAYLHSTWPQKTSMLVSDSGRCVKTSLVVLFFIMQVSNNELLGNAFNVSFLMTSLKTFWLVALLKSLLFKTAL